MNTWTIVLSINAMNNELVRKHHQAFSQPRLVHRNITLPNFMHDKSIEMQPMPWFLIRWLHNIAWALINNWINISNLSSS